MQNLKQIRKVKKMSNRQNQRERELQGSTSVRMPLYSQGSQQLYDNYLDFASLNSNQEGNLSMVYKFCGIYLLNSCCQLF